MQDAKKELDDGEKEYADVHWIQSILHSRIRIRVLKLSIHFYQLLLRKSYIIFNVLATFLICFCVLLVSYIYLGAVGGFHISVGHTFLLIPILLLSVVSASLITCFVTSFLTNYNTYNSISVIISSGSGFLIGAFMPVSMLPSIAKNVPLFFPGTYSAGLLRTFCLQGYYENFYNILVGQYGAEKARSLLETLNERLSMNINFFGHDVSPGYMALAIFIFAFIFDN